MAALTDRIGTVRVRAAEDSPQTRLAASDVVRHVVLPTAGPSRRAILVIRSIDNCRLDPGQRAAFAAGLQRRVAECWRTARSPGPAAATTNAVVFRDLTELLAHYVIDLTGSRVGERWWWAALRGRFAPNDTVAGVLAEQIIRAPSVLAELRTLGRLPQVVAALDGPTCARLITTLADVHAAPRLVEALAALTAPAPNGRPTPTAAVAHRWLVEALAGVRGPRRRLFVATALQLADDPVVARSPAFLTAAVVIATSQPASTRESDAVDDDQQRPAGTAGGPRGSAVRVDHPAANPEAPSLSPPPQQARAAMASDAPEAIMFESARFSTTAPSATAKATDGQQFPTAGTRPQAQHPPAQLPPAGGNADPIGARDGVMTDLGGVFFLVEFVRGLQLPDRFEDEWQLTSRLGWWGTIEILARSLVPNNPARARDPIWTVFTELAGGRRAFDRARSIPAHATTTDLIELPPQREVSTDVSLPPIDTTLAHPASHGLRRWLDLTRAPVCSLLADRLDCRPGELSEKLIERRARVEDDRTHVDVHYQLASATVAVRRAGLDRDPGWVPALGRVITFHFDDDLDAGS